MEGRAGVTRYVLDTSVVVKWFSESSEEDLEKALLLRKGILEGAVAATVPSLLYYELGNALRFNPNFSVGDVRDAVASIFDMGFSVREVTAAILTSAVDWAFTRRITVYDACFLALAEAEGVPMVTADDRLLGRLKGIEHAIGLSKLA